MKDLGDGRKNEFPQGSVNALSIGVVDSLCDSDEDSSSV